MLPPKAWVYLWSSKQEATELFWYNPFKGTYQDDWNYGWKENHSTPVTGQNLCAYYDNDPEHPGLQVDSCDIPNIPAICYIPYQY